MDGHDDSRPTFNMDRTACKWALGVNFDGFLINELSKMKIT